MKKIIIVGAGFAGLRAYVRLRKQLPKAKITLFDPKPYFEYVPGLHLALGNSKRLKSLQFPLSMYKEWKQERVQEVNPAAKTLLTDKREYTYDYLIIACGAPTNYFGNTNLEQYALPAKTSEQLKIINKKVPKAKSITLIGGGISGVEYASVICHHKDKQINIISSTDRLVPALDEKGSEVAKKYLEERGVNVILNARAESATNKTLTLSNGETIDSDLTLMCTGIKQEVPFLKDVQVDENLYFKEGIFLCGDSVRTSFTPTAHNAMLEGDDVAKHIISLINTGEFAKVHTKNWTTLAIALGHHFGCISHGKKSYPFPLTGFGKWVIERRVIHEFKNKVLLPI